jgi:outer membrane protein OmpA-like peptidoglycan-associated protein
MKEAIDKDGKARLYGILFDVGKSEIKPESSEALKQITDYLTTNQTIKVIIVGHTDNSGTYSNNMTLSKARAESIKNYLITKSKIAASRLLSEGVGQVCPVSNNNTEDGRKLNRRVEIVKQ